MVTRNERRRRARARAARAQAAEAQESIGTTQAQDQVATPATEAGLSSVQSDSELEAPKGEMTNSTAEKSQPESPSSGDRAQLIGHRQGEGSTEAIGLDVVEQIRRRQPEYFLRVRVKKLYENLPVRYHAHVERMIRAHLRWERAILYGVRRFIKDSGLRFSRIGAEVAELERLDGSIQRHKFAWFIFTNCDDYKQIMESIEEQERKKNELNSSAIEADAEAVAGVQVTMEFFPVNFHQMDDVLNGFLDDVEMHSQQFNIDMDVGQRVVELDEDEESSDGPVTVPDELQSDN
ncbi:hypothetical protein L228DRAFT_259031 [Xylona heveae TC161]|uniref:Uncharacterized protein n=1 Tax=Xylona heveae (strain CBS 132557 / TC161) TaxID=1328760 RepID=A0A165J299_XYLHT|nr:hypothetical protein L228DRAFT_259031 [Xylona heveae TC161]KZF25636.1 hypothetical protein L228DRAFT_259031 [Xylona heveae TC161]